MAAIQYPAPGMIGMSFLFLLVAFMGAGALINHFAKRPAVNGASIFLVVTGLLVFIKIVIAARNSASAEAVGEMVGEHLIPVLIAGILAYRFSKRKNGLKVSGGENS